MRPPPSALRFFPLLLLALVLSLPVLALLAAWLPWGQGGAQAVAILREMASTVLPGYFWTTLWLGLWVALGAACVGMATAAAVTLFDFPGRRQMEWLLLLPLAMPAYVTAYAYTDFLQFSGPLQTWLRAGFGLEGRVLPEVRIVELDITHPIFHAFFDVATLDFVQFYGRGEKPYFMAAYEDNDPSKRLLFIANYNNDVGEYWEFSDTGWTPIDLSNEAYKLGVNYIVYALTH